MRFFSVLVYFAAVLAAESIGIEAPKGLKVLPRQLRVDLVWVASAPSAHYEVQAAAVPEGPFRDLKNEFPSLNFFSGDVGKAGVEQFYRVRAILPQTAEHSSITSTWSQIVSGVPEGFDAERLLTEVQEAGFRYFYDFAHPVSGLAREGLRRNPDLCAIGATGMGLFNLVTGIERGFVTRYEAALRSQQILRFLQEKTDRYHGAFPHMVNGTTGKTIPFSRYDDGADLVETAFLMQGVLFLREYFDATNSVETEVRKRADELWRGVEWSWFIQEQEDGAALMWHWSPNHGWKNQLRINGFNEAQIVYILAMASPTYPIDPNVYRKGWYSQASYGSARTQFGVPLELDHEFGPPLFFTHYSYLSLDPRQISFRGRTYFDHFRDLCRVQVSYSDSRRKDFKGYGSLWGITASYGPDGYRAFAPGALDNGTLAPTAALSSMPYLPEASRACLVEMYEKHGQQLWGPFGFYDAFNFSRDWVARDYLGIDVGPIGPMIENHRTGLCWKTFMKAPEVAAITSKLVSQAGPPTNSSAPSSVPAPVQSTPVVSKSPLSGPLAAAPKETLPTP